MSAFAPQRMVKEAEFMVPAPPEKVFPLLCPVREYDWVESWRCRLIYSRSGVAEPGCIFETDFDFNGGPETWVVSRYAPNAVIEFVRFTAGEKVVKLEIALTAEDDASTRLVWRKIYTGLSAEGNTLVRRLAGEQFKLETRKIAAMLEHYLVTGRMLREAALAGDPD